MTDLEKKLIFFYKTYVSEVFQEEVSVWEESKIKCIFIESVPNLLNILQVMIFKIDNICEKSYFVYNIFQLNDFKYYININNGNIQIDNRQSGLFCYA